MGEMAYLCFGWAGKYIIDFFLVVTQCCFTVSIFYFIRLNVTPVLFGDSNVSEHKATFISSKVNGTVTITEIKSKTIHNQQNATSSHSMSSG